MGTTYSVGVYGEGADRIKALKPEIDKILREVNRQMSTYIPDSEIVLLNQHQSSSPFKISRDFLKVLEYSLSLGKKTSGAYDVTVGPLVELWGFGAKGRRDQAPSEKEIAATRDLVGGSKVSIQPDGSVVKLMPRVQVDLSSSAKGFGVDKISDFLKRRAFKAYLVEIGGEIRAVGDKGKKGPWRVAVEKPEIQGGIQKVFALREMSMATSGDYRNFFRDKGKRYSHTLDPRTAKPVEHGLASVTVLAPECMRADAIATALMVMGEAEGRAWANKNDIKAYFLFRKDDRLQESMSLSFKTYIEQHPL